MKKYTTKEECINGKWKYFSWPSGGHQISIKFVLLRITIVKDAVVWYFGVEPGIFEIIV